MIKEVTLTEEQEKAREECLFFLSSTRRAVLKGSAGTGKTTLLRFIIEDWTGGGKIAVAAPTHKAVAVLKEKIPAGPKVMFGTVHKLLELKGRRDDRGNLVFQSRQGSTPMRGITLLIIDEASMVNQELHELIKECSAPFNTAVLFVGDPKQLNPVNEEDSAVFADKELPISPLTTIMRQAAQNPILNLAYNLDKMKLKERKEFEDGSGIVYSDDESKIVKALAGDMDERNYTYLAWTNAAVDRMNGMVRYFKYPEVVDDFVVGETVMFGNMYKDFYNSERYIISHSVEKIDYPVTTLNQRFVFRCYRIDGDIITLRKSSVGLFKKMMAQLGQACKMGKEKWSEYERVENIFAILHYTYALTVHKAQGSEWDAVILNVYDMNRNRNTVERDRMLYTAVTRASRLLIIYGL